MTLILASGSMSRRHVLAAAGVPFTVIQPDLDETALKDGLLAAKVPIEHIATSLADAKALQVSKLRPGALVLGGDQALLFSGELISKCLTMAEGRTLLRRLRGSEHVLSGALTLAIGGHVIWRHAELARLWMRDFSDRFLDNYLAQEGEGILSAVGCYKLESLGAQLFDRIEGDYFSILGLPLLPLLAELRKQGVIAS